MFWWKECKQKPAQTQTGLECTFNSLFTLGQKYSPYLQWGRNMTSKHNLCEELWERSVNELSWNLRKYRCFLRINSARECFLRINSAREFLFNANDPGSYN